jgi:tRNA threonylcarbamoyladenosine biosynthesis protein TsaE
MLLLCRQVCYDALVMESKEVIVGSEEDLAAAAAELLEILKAVPKPWVIALVGELGAGKTRLVKLFARMLGIDEEVTSPTFLLMRTYSVGTPAYPEIARLVHVDAYRASAKELADLGWKDLISSPENVVMVEWADRVADLMPSSAVWVRLSTEGARSRKVHITYDRD